MNKIKFLFYKLTHSILCKLGYHRLINWSGSAELEDQDGNPTNDLECWCGDVDNWPKLPEFHDGGLIKAEDLISVSDSMYNIEFIPLGVAQSWFCIIAPPYPPSLLEKDPSLKDGKKYVERWTQAVTGNCPGCRHDHANNKICKECVEAYYTTYPEDKPITEGFEPQFFTHYGHRWVLTFYWEGSQ